MSGQQTSQTQQQQTNVANPVAQAAIAPIANLAPGIAATPYSQSMNVNVAGLNPQQLAAIQGLGGLQTNNPASSYLNQANQYSQQAADPNSVLRMQSAFYNPMASAVEAQLGNVFGQQNAQLLGNAASSGAIGGSRYGVAAGNLANQQGLAAGQTLAGLQQQALNAAQTEQGQISQQAFTQGQLGQQALNTQLQGINAALQGGNITQQQAQALYNAATQNAIQQTLFPQQEAAAGMNIAQGAIPLGGTTYGTGTTSQPVNYAGQIIGAGLAGVGALGGVGGISNLFGGGGSNTPQFGAYGGAMRKRADGGATTDSSPLENYFEHQPQVTVAQPHYPTLNLGPQGGQGAAGQAGAGGGGSGLGGLGSLASLGSSAMSGIGDLGGSLMSGIGSLGSAIGSGIGELGGAIGGALGSAGDFLPFLALLKDGGAVKHRVIGGGTGVGRGTTGLLGYSGLSGGLEPYFAQMPKVNVSQANFPTLSLGQGPNSAQQQVDQQTQQMTQLAKLGQDIGKQYPISSGSDIEAARGGRIHRQDGGLLSLSPEDKQNLDYLRGGAPSWLGGDTGNTPPPSAQPIGPSALQRFLNERRSASLHASPLDYDAQPKSLSPQPLLQNASLAQSSTPEKLSSASATTMGDLSPTPGPGQYILRGYDGRPIGGPQTPEQDLALIQRAPIQQAALGPTQTPQPTPPAPIAQPAQPVPPPLTPHGVVQNTIDTFRGGGGSDNLIRGILINYNDESGFNPGLRHPDQDPHKWFGESRYAHGLAQEGGAEWNRYVNWLGQNGHHASDWADPSLQNQFLLWNLKTNYPQVWDAMNNAPTAEQSAQAFLRGYLKPSFANQERRAAQYERGIPGIDDFVNNAGTKSFSTRSVLSDPSLQPPAKEDTNLRQIMRSFGYNLDQPQGLGGSLGRALGIQGGLDPQTANRLVGLGLGMMAAGPSVGIPGLAGALSGTLTAFGKGGQFALNQEQQERAQAINLANAAMNQKLHEAQIQHLQAQIGQPQVRGETFDPTTFQWIKQYERYNPDTGTREPIPLGGKTGEATDIPDIAPGLSGEAFIAEARKAGISPQHLEIAKQAAAYKDDPNKLYSSFRGNQRAIIDMLAHRINPDYEMTRYPAVADAEKKLYSGNTGQSIARIGRLFDEIAIANEAADNLKKQGASGYETINEQYSRFSKSDSPYAKARDALGYAIDNLSQSAASVAKGNNTQAEGDASRRFKLLNPDKAPDNLKNTFRLEAETALWNAQTNLTLANKAHGYAPDNPKYFSAFDFMNPAQKQKVLQILGADKVEEITGKPVTDADLQQSAKIFKTKEGKEFQPQQAKPSQSQVQPTSPQPQQAAIPPRPAGKSDEQLKREAEETIAQHPGSADAVNARLKEWLKQ